MIKINNINNFLILVIITMISCTTIFAETNSNADNVVAKYNETDVTASMVMKKLSPVLSSQPETKGKKFTEFDKNTQEMLIKQYVFLNLIDEEIKKRNIKNSSEFKKKIKSLSRQLELEVFFDKVINKKIHQKDIDQEYDKIVDEMKDQKSVTVSHILLKTEEDAKKAKSELDKGKNFVEVVHNYSVDKSNKDGFLGELNRHELFPEFAAVAYSMNTNSYSQPVKTKHGWHIIYLHNIGKAKIPSKKEMTNMITMNLTNKASMQYMSDLLKKSNLVIM